MPIDVTVEDIVRNLAKNIKFNQPMYEAIVNSLEANATKIELEIFHDNPIEGVCPKITGFTITDNGEGFTEKNRVSFTKLWTNNKIALGCKGSGRFTWLSVYENISITSQIINEQNLVTIPFNKQFSKADIHVDSSTVDSNKTVIKFSDITDKYYTNIPDVKIIDKRTVADVNQLCKSITEYLLIKLFFLKQAGINFEIILKMDENCAVINKDSIPDLKFTQFSIESEIDKETYDFILYYHFINDTQNRKRVYYCTNNRATKEVGDETLGFSCNLPNSNSFTMLVCSDYFNDKDDDGRTDLTELSNQKNASLFVPLLLADINPVVKKVIAQIIHQEYPELDEINTQALNAAKNEAPYLTQYFKQDNDIVKTKDSILTNARKKFNEVKIKSQKKFEQLLQTRNIESEDLSKEIENVSMIAAAELGEYILYRDNIIKALQKSLNQPSYNEKYVHDIFMPMKTDSEENDNEKHLLSNLWLIDDKFMTYSYAASDKTINHIADKLGDRSVKFFKRLNRPDLALFFDKKDGKKDVIMVEFKGVNADKSEKDKSLTELPIDIRIIRDNLSDVRSIWSYIITTIDDDFKYTIESLDKYTELFSNDSEFRAYYSYNEKSNAHIYIVDLKTIISDAFARNKTFLDILKKQ